jgi:hypothetical protein
MFALTALELSPTILLLLVIINNIGKMVILAWAAAKLG